MKQETLKNEKEIYFCIRNLMGTGSGIKLRCGPAVL